MLPLCEDDGEDGMRAAAGLVHVSGSHGPTEKRGVEDTKTSSNITH